MTIVAAKEYTDLLNDIADIYHRNCLGGPLHIVLDDGNTDDESIQFCMDTCHSHWSVTEDADNANSLIQLVESVGKRLLQLDESERDRLFGSRWGRLETLL